MIILVTKINYKISGDEFKSLSYKVAEELNDPEMYKWKIWAVDEKNSTGLTVYCLDDEAQADKVIDYLNTMGLIYSSILHNISIEKYEILEEPTRLNFGPIGSPEDFSDQLDTEQGSINNTI